MDAVGSSSQRRAARPQLSLFDPPRRDKPEDDEPLLVRLSRVRLERVRDFDDVWLAWGLWRMSGLDGLLETLIEPGREDVSWATVAGILVLARFCEPSSELHIAETWYRRTALDDLLGVGEGFRLGYSLWGTRSSRGTPMTRRRSKGSSRRWNGSTNAWAD